MVQTVRMQVAQIAMTSCGVAAEMTEQMPIADACIKEILRLHDPATLVFRKALQDIQVGDKLIPKVCPALLR